MYRSHPVRRMCADPLEEEPVTLILTAINDQARDRIHAALNDMDDLDATVADHLQFAALRVETTEDTVENICALEGIESVETDNVVGHAGNAGEEVGE